ncbi:hypothetical protein DFH08DRAFT_815622 [Mycena albidolilacea]|uniref:Secreted protein n=1 Tax=Mycena albidolilacea TaxID=1033008 RepID=A0AAD7EKG7_9AGAR|nr:hypothetical protein DFH08DRAFT_815622 [Mycena albidolilacea]
MLALALSLVVHALVLFYFFIAPVSTRHSTANTSYPPPPTLPYHPSPEDGSCLLDFFSSRSWKHRMRVTRTINPHPILMVITFKTKSGTINLKAKARIIKSPDIHQFQGKTRDHQYRWPSIGLWQAAEVASDALEGHRHKLWLCENTYHLTH